MDKEDFGAYEEAQYDSPNGTGDAGDWIAITGVLIGIPALIGMGWLITEAIKYNP